MSHIDFHWLDSSTRSAFLANITTKSSQRINPHCWNKCIIKRWLTKPKRLRVLYMMFVTYDSAWILDQQDPFCHKASTKRDNTNRALFCIGRSSTIESSKLLIFRRDLKQNFNRRRNHRRFSNRLSQPSRPFCRSRHHKHKVSSTLKKRRLKGQRKEALSIRL